MGGGLYTNPLEFDFTWKYNFEKKIHLYILEEEMEEKPIFEVVRRLSTCIMGDLVILPAEEAKYLWDSVKEAMEELISVGFIDDDQLLLLMAYRKNKEKFILKRSDWFLPLKEYGGEHLTTAVSKKKINRMKSKWNQIVKMLRYLIQVVQVCIKR